MDEILELMGLYRDYVRIKVEIDTTKPRLEGVWYTRRNSSIGRVEVKYERLSNFCLGCGKIGHIERVISELEE